MKFRSTSVSVASMLVALGFSTVANGQTLPACRSTARTCNDVAGITDRHASDRFVDVPVSQQAAALPACTPADQPSVGDCDATLRRHNRQGRIVTVTVPTGGGVLALDPTPPPPAAPRAPSGRDRTARREIEALRPYAMTGYENSLVLNGNLNTERAQRIAGDQQLLANQQQLANQQAATSQRVDGFDFRLADLGSEMRYRIFTTSRVSAQMGGTRVITTPGLGFGFVKWGERSNWGIDFQASVSGYADQALVPGSAPLMNLSTSLGAAVGRVWPVQLVFGLSLSLTGRFGDAGQGEATGPTQGSASAFVGVRGEHPFFPRTERPNGAAFFWQVRGGGGAGFVQTILQRPLIGGATGELDLALGVTL